MILDFGRGDSIIDVSALGMSSEALAVVLGKATGTAGGMRLDLADFGGGTIELQGVSAGDVDAGDFLL